jgi:site-specific recombinase XerC
LGWRGGRRCWSDFMGYSQLIDIQELLGHESIAITQIYTHARQKRLSRLVEGW